MAAERSAAIFFLLKHTDCEALFQLERRRKRAREARALMAALLPVAVHLYVVANRMVMIVRESRGHHADSNGGKRKRKQNLLHGLGWSDDLVD